MAAQTIQDMQNGLDPVQAWNIPSLHRAGWRQEMTNMHGEAWCCGVSPGAVAATDVGYAVLLWIACIRHDSTST